MLPHFLFMGLVALIWYNNQLGGLRLYPYLKGLIIEKALDPRSLLWAVPLFTGFGLSVLARYLELYRYRWGAQPPTSAAMALDADLASLFGRGRQMATPALRAGRWWNPVGYRRAAWVFRGLGLALLAASLFQFETPTFVTFMFVKGFLGMLLLAESAALLGPLLTSRFTSWLEDRVTRNPNCWRLTRFIANLNLVPTRPASLLWLSIQYHFQPSV